MEIAASLQLLAVTGELALSAFTRDGRVTGSSGH